MNSAIEEIKRKVNEAQGGLVVRGLSEVADPSAPIRGLSSGSVRLNIALSGRPLVGYSWGRTVEIFGPEQSGKTTLSLHALAEAQKLGLPCGFIDAEHALDVRYAASIGVNIDDLLFSQPDYGEQALGTIQHMVENGTKVVVVDSVAALTPKAEIDGEMTDHSIGLQARMMGQAMRKLTGIISRQEALVIFLNQIREKIGVFFGNPETTSGGKALKFYASYRLDVRAPRGGASKEKRLGGDTVETGIDTNIKIVKNKVFPPFRTAQVHIEYGKGIDRYLDVASFLSDGKSVTWKGRSYKVNAFASRLREDKQLRKDVLSNLKQEP
jgi:recombination protein RecA